MSASGRGRAAGLRSIPELGELFERLFSQLPIALQIFAADGTCLLANDEFVRQFGSAPPPTYNVLADEHLAASGVARSVRRAFAGEVVALNTRASALRATAPGHDSRLAVTLLPVRDQDGELTHVVLTFRDATGEELALAAERAQRDLLRMVIDSIAEGVIVADEAGRVLLSNPALPEVAGSDAPLGSPWPADWPARYHVYLADQETPFPADEGALARALRGDSTDNVEMCIVRGDGPPRWIRSSGRPLRDAEGRPRGGVAVLRDVTAHKQAEQELAAQRAAWQALVECAPDTIMRLDVDGRIQFVNRLVRGLRQDDVVGRSWFEFVPPEVHDTIRDALATARLTGATTTWETSGPGPNGEVAWYACSLGPITDGERTVGAVVIARDVTLARQAEAQLMVSDRLASVGTLAAGVAHEINNPLAAVVANVELVTRQVADLVAAGHASPELLDELRDAHDGVDRVRNIVRDLRLFSRSDEAQAGPVDLTRVLESTLRMVFNEVKHRARLIKHYGDVPPVLASEGRLGQVFLNLLINAVQAIPEGDADHNTITVTTSTRSDGKAVVSVRDTGAGIPEDLRTHIFTPFFTTKAVGVGAGLGLSICHRIVTQLGGEISYASHVGRGTEFTVTLPAAVPATVPAPRPAPATTPPSTQAARPARRGHILVVDDEPIVTRSVKRALDRAHDVVAMNSPRQALEAIVAGARFDLILCDLMMPEMTGMDLYAELQRIAPNLVPKVVFLTGGAFTPRAREFLFTVPNLTLEKPFSTSELRAIVGERVAQADRED